MNTPRLSLLGFGVIFATAVATQLSRAETSFQVNERGAFHRKWERLSSSTNTVTGEITQQTNAFIEISSGLHFWDNGWRESGDLIEIDGLNAVARRGQHTVRWSNNCRTENAVELTAIDGLCLRSRVLGLYYFDAESGECVELASLTGSIGLLFAPNQLVYPDCFDGANGVRADLQYVYTKGGFQQNVVLLSRPAPPEQFGLNSAKTRLEIWTGFASPRQPAKSAKVLKSVTDPIRRAAMAEPDLIDETLDFTSLWFLWAKHLKQQSRFRAVLHKFDWLIRALVTC